MRALVLVLLLAGCSQPEPSVQLAGDIAPPVMPYVCSVTGEEAMMYVSHTGEVFDPIPTGRSCDYAAYRAWKERSEGNADARTAP